MEIIKEAVHNYDFALCNCDNNNSTDSCLADMMPHGINAQRTNSCDLQF